LELDKWRSQVEKFIFLDLTLGAKPENEQEDTMARETRSIKDSGDIVEIPSN